MITITKTLYHLADLKGAAREKAISAYQYANTEFDDWYDNTLAEEIEKLAAEGYEDAKISFSGFASQGDGASFTCNVNIPAWIKANRRANHYRALLRHVEKTNGITLKIKRTSHQYSHENTVGTEMDGHADYEASDSVTKQACALESEVLAVARLRMKEIYRTLESEYDALTEDEAVAETIEANEYTFNESGQPES